MVANEVRRPMFGDVFCPVYKVLFTSLFLKRHKSLVINYPSFTCICGKVIRADMVNLLQNLRRLLFQVYDITDSKNLNSRTRTKLIIILRYAKDRDSKVNGFVDNIEAAMIHVNIKSGVFQKSSMRDKATTKQNVFLI